jgi:hypothetical protein
MVRIGGRVCHLLLKIVQPLLTHRELTDRPSSTRGPGSAWTFLWISRPKPSEYEKLTCILRPSCGSGSLRWVSRAKEAEYTGSHRLWSSGAPAGSAKTDGDRKWFGSLLPWANWVPIHADRRHYRIHRCPFCAMSGSNPSSESPTLSSFAFHAVPIPPTRMCRRQLQYGSYWDQWLA